MSDDDGAGLEGLAELYRCAYGRLVVLVTAVGGDRESAQEVVQDAFVRLIPQWPRVSAYDDPEAWLRKVALGLLSNRRRKLRNGARALLRHGPAPDVLPATGDVVDLHRALRPLPVPQREVLVLVHLAGVDLTSTARVLGVPVGTVKSRLSRARTALASLLAEEFDRA